MRAAVSPPAELGATAASKLHQSAPGGFLSITQAAQRRPCLPEGSAGSDFEVHEGRIPDGTEQWLEWRYASLYSSLPQLRLSGLDGINTYVDFDALPRDQVPGDASPPLQEPLPAAIFLYRQARDALHVVNEGMCITATEAERFALRMFGRHSALRSVHWHAIDMTGEPALLPLARFDCSEDIVLELPVTETAYLQALGKATRKSLRQRMRRAGGLEHRVVAGADIAADLVDRIIGFNHARMAAKSRRSALNGEAATRLRQLLRERGLIGLTSIDGQLCGGTLACRIANDVFSLVNAHDPTHDPIGLGNLCRHLMIIDAIRRGMRRFHLLGGNYASKRSCLGQRITLQHVVIYRDRRSQYADVRVLVRLWLQQATLRTRRWLDDVRHRPTKPRP